MSRFDLAVVNAKAVITSASFSPGPKRGRAMGEIHPITGGAVGIVGEKIAWIGTEAALRRRHGAKRRINAQGGLILPGLVDCHTHAVFAGTRVPEWQERLSGTPYLEILRRGGGILNTVMETRRASPKCLAQIASSYLIKMMIHGTTTVEIKSGYGLRLAEELKILKTIRRLQKTLPIDIVPTFLGAHAIPPEYAGRSDAYVRKVLQMLPQVSTLARFCDVFCEEGAFDARQTEAILSEAKRRGMQVKLHAGEFHDLGGVEVGLRHQAVSIDHLDVISAKSIRRMARTDTIGVLLPAVSHFLSAERYAPARRLIDTGVPVALATDFNPGSSPCLSLQEIMALAVLRMSMSPEEALTAVTINAAAAIGLEHTIGSLEEGKQADLICIDLEDMGQIPYFFGANHVRWVIKRGRWMRERSLT